MTKELGRPLQVLGAVLIFAALIWWAAFYSEVDRTVGGAVLSRSFQCIFYTTAPCEITTRVAEIAGYWGYHPYIFWIGLLFLFGGNLAERMNLGAGEVYVSRDIATPRRRSVASTLGRGLLSVLTFITILAVIAGMVAAAIYYTHANQ